MDTTSYQIKENGNFPNNEKLPLILYKAAFQEENGNEIKEIVEKNGWSGTWTNGVFNYHHYHSASHEVLVVLYGSATLIFGGPGGNEVHVRKGDAVIIPAGVGHYNKSADPDFKVLGAYPGGQEDYDICTENDDPEEKKQNIQNVPLPEKDPIYGKNGAIPKEWDK